MGKNRPGAWVKTGPGPTRKTLQLYNWLLTKSMIGNSVVSTWQPWKKD